MKRSIFLTGRLAAAAAASVVSAFAYTLPAMAQTGAPATPPTTIVPRMFISTA